MIKIGHFIDSTDPGGAESVVIELCIQQIKRNQCVEVMHFGNTWLEEKCIENKINQVKVPFYFLYKSKYTLPLFTILFTFFILNRRLSVIHTHLFDTIIPTAIASILTGIPHIATLHDVYSIEDQKFKHIILKYSSMFGTRIVAVSNQIIEHIGSLAVVDKSTIYLIRNGVNLHKYNPRKADRVIPIGLNINKEDNVIISVGRLVPIKGYSNLLSSFQLVSNKISSVKLIVVGDGPEKDNLITSAFSLGLSNQIFFLGQRDDVPDLLRLSDIFALSSLSEGLSCSIIEAMASGLPVVATDVGGNSELITDNVNGYLVPEGNIELFSNRLMDLLLDKIKREEYSSMSHLIANREFSTESMCDKYERLYDLPRMT